MKIRITNIGPISEFEIDLSKKLTAIFGLNNTGKSYALRVVYLVLKSLPCINSRTDLIKTINETLAHRDGESTMGLILNLNDLLASYMKMYFCPHLNKNLTDEFGSVLAIKPLLKRECFSTIEISTPKLMIRQIYNFWYDDFFDGIEIFIVPEADISQKSGSPELLRAHFVEMLANFFNEVKRHNSSFHYLSSNRSGLYLALRSIEGLMENQNNRRLICESFVKSLNSGIARTEFLKTINQIWKSVLPSEFTKQATEIQQRLLDGSLEVDYKKGGILFKPRVSESLLEFQNLSASLSENVLLCIFIKFILTAKFSEDLTQDKPTHLQRIRPVLIIEEPEIHHHPEAQITLMEELVKLASNGVQIIYTSYSDFMLDTLVNEILAGKIADTEIGSLLLIKTKEGSVMSDKMAVVNGGIKDLIFYKAIDELYKERIRLNDLRNDKLARKKLKP